MLYKRKAKIVATLGPATRSFDVIKEMADAGVNVFRMNFSHSTYEEHKEAYNNIRRMCKDSDTVVAILADLQGPKLRIDKFQTGSITLKTHQKFTFDLKNSLGNEDRVYLPHPQVFEAVKVGDHMLIDDGKIKLQVESCGADYIETKVLISGVISDYKGVNFPSGVLNLSPITAKDKKDLEFALSLGVDFIALSFVQRALDVDMVKRIIGDRAKLIAKIEKPSAVEHISSIAEVADGVMIARGDLGVEIPSEKVPAVQKHIIRECIKYHKPVIVATQMLDSMIDSPIPTRAEASDVANAIYDGADAVMLSGETTVGKYPVEAVKVMARILNNVEDDPYYWKHTNVIVKSSREKGVSSIGRSIASAAKEIAETMDSKVIVAFSSHGTTINRISNQKPKVQILGVTNSPLLYNQMSLNWGVIPVLVGEFNTFSEVAEASIKWLKEHDVVKVEDKVVFVSGIPVSVGGRTNSIRVAEVD